MRKSIIAIIVIAASALVFGAAFGAETEFGNAKGFGWQERARVCAALTEQQCSDVVALQTGGGDGSGAAGDSGDAGASSGASSGGNGDGCGPR